MLNINNTQQKSSQETSSDLEMTKEQYKSFFKFNPDGMFILNSKGIITDVNPALIKMTEYFNQELLNHQLTILFPIKEKELRDKYLKPVLNGQPKSLQTNLVKKTNKLIDANVLFIPIIVKGKVTGVQGIVKDITEEIRTQQIIKNMAYYDQLTSLPNRNLFDIRLEELMIEAASTKKYLALLFLDLDQFKSINDTLGHNEGDELLKLTAAKLQKCIAKDDFLARLGGDEFVILLKCASPDAAAKLATKILAEISQPFNLHGYDVMITPSIGISVYPNDGQIPKEIIKTADTAMYSAKEHGKNCFQFYKQNSCETTLQKLEIKNHLRQALNKNEFILNYQPQIDISLSRIIGVEALVRWKHPQLGIISPMDFIPLAEKMGLIIPLGEWVLRTACHDLNEWLDQGATLGKLSVNISAIQLAQKDFCDKVIDILETTQLDPGYLELEITESFMLDYNNVRQTIHRLREKGIKIAIDDFGTGYSPLSHLKEVSVDTLKIDRGFINGIDSNYRNKIIIQTIVQMAKMMKLNIIAEGVETLEQLTYLASLHLNEIQGYYFSPPIAKNDFENLIL